MKPCVPNATLTTCHGQAPSLIGPPVRNVVTTHRVQVLGPVQFEPSMVRVRFANGAVSRVFKDSGMQRIDLDEETP